MLHHTLYLEMAALHQQQLRTEAARDQLAIEALQNADQRARHGSLRSALRSFALRCVALL